MLCNFLLRDTNMWVELANRSLHQLLGMAGSHFLQGLHPLSVSLVPCLWCHLIQLNAAQVHHLQLLFAELMQCSQQMEPRHDGSLPGGQSEYFPDSTHHLQTVGPLPLVLPLTPGCRSQGDWEFCT